MDSKFNGSTIGNILLEPTRIYLQTMAEISKNYDAVGINNTGYGLKNFNRLEGFEFRINKPSKPQPIFELMQKESKFSDKKMYETFNMGMGFFVICKPKEVNRILQIAKGGEVVRNVSGKGKTKCILEKEGKKIVFERY